MSREQVIHEHHSMTDFVEDDRHDALDPQRQPDVRTKSVALQCRVQRAH